MPEYLVKGEIDASKVELSADAPLRIAAVRDGEILASAALQPTQRGRIHYELPFFLPFPCGFHLVLGRLDVPNKILVAAPLAHRWVGPEAMVQRKVGEK
jgi:hypothetical protein